MGNFQAPALALSLRRKMGHASHELTPGIEVRRFGPDVVDHLLRVRKGAPRVGAPFLDGFG
jgi:hypothetical protein